MNKEDRRRMQELKRDKNEELRKNAPIPADEFDIRGVRFENVHNGIIMEIVGHWVGDMGVILWTSDAGDIYSTRDIKGHWIMQDIEEPEGW